MRAWYEKYYKIRENERISDKKMMVRFVVTLVIIIVCLIGMSATSIAFYTVSVETGSNTVTPSTFYVNVESQAETGTVTEKYKSLYKSTYTVGANTTCTFTLTLPSDTKDFATTGYCKITSDPAYLNTASFYTKQFGTNVYDVNSSTPTTRNTVTFTVKTSNSPVEICIEPCWGTCALEPIQDNGYNMNFS